MSCCAGQVRLAAIEFGTCFLTDRAYRARDRAKQAERQFARLSPRYVELRWSKLEALQLAHCVALQEQLNLDKERLLSSLALLRAGTTLIARQWSLSCLSDEVIGQAHCQPTIASGLMNTVKTISSTLTKGVLNEFPVYQGSCRVRRFCRNRFPHLRHCRFRGVWHACKICRRPACLCARRKWSPLCWSRHLCPARHIC